MDVFRFRLNCIDHYQAAPSEFDPQLPHGHGPSQRECGPPVPVIRVFGATEAGQKVCAHIHGALPYLYIEYDGSLEQDAVESYIQALRMSIEHALATSYRRNAYDGKAIFVGHISLVKGTPYYGYHVGYRTFLKVYLLNPAHMTRLADIMHQGVILNRVIQPFESHLQYLAQWMCDYNLFGCAYIDCAKVKFRTPVPDYLELSNLNHKWHDRSIPRELLSNAERLPRQSHCSIEVDIRVEDILNRKEVRERPLHHDFMERFSHLMPDEKLVPSMAGLWRDETRRRKRKMGIQDPSSSPFPPEVLVSMSADPRNTDKGGWIHEDEFQEMIKELVQKERQEKVDANISFEKFVRNDPLLDGIQTAFQSIEELHSKNLEHADLLVDDVLLTGVDQTGESLATAAGVDASSSSLSDDRGAGPAPDTMKHNRPDLEGLSNEQEASELDNELRFDDESHGSGFQELEVPDNVATSSGSQSSKHENDSTLIRREIGILERNQRRNAQVVKRSQSPSDASPPKRRRVSIQLDGNAGSVPRTDKSARHVDFAIEAVRDHDSGSPSNSQDHRDTGFGQSSQGSIKAHGLKKPGTLSFPVVKNPSDPHTVSRLSQSEYSNSPKSPRTPAKHVAYDGQDTPRTPWSNTKSPGMTSTVPGSPQQSETITQAASVLDYPSNCRVYIFASPPPASDWVETTMADFGLPPAIYQDAYYSNEKDVPDRPREYAGQEFKLGSNTLPYLPSFDPTGKDPALYGNRTPAVVDKSKVDSAYERVKQQCTLRNWEIAAPPPSYAEVENWLRCEDRVVDIVEVDVDTIAQQLANPRPLPGTHLSQIDGPTQKNKHGFKYSQREKSDSVQHETQYMSIMSLEVHVNTRGTLVPDPEHDEIACVFWCNQSDDDDGDKDRIGILALSESDGIAKNIARQVSVEVEHEEDELELLNRLIDIVREFDPDILTGYEVHNGSWGYLIERARLKYEFDFCNELSRVKSQSHGRFGRDADRWGFTNTSTIRITGRHMINLWRAMRGELNLLQYTLENVAFHLLHKRIPHYSHPDLTAWYRSTKPRDLAKTLDYFLSRVQLNLEILDVNELISRTSEQARLLGVDFFSVFSRGSQFKVESLMFRIAKPENFILISPSRAQVGKQNALECLPLVMEPQSAFYTSPLVILDFQSLYPSVMIAYNYCYSTCLGRVVSWRGQNKMGFTDFKREPRLLELVKDHINIAPNGMMYVRPEMRKSLLAKMLGEILETRVMVKSGMRQDKDEKALQQLLNNRQLALKLIANVTYGYTSASFSGRMPCSEIADSIVQTGRETLEKAIALIHSVERWGAEVVYGDTDSLFIYLKGRTREQAFAIGQEIADAVTNTNPRPIKLKFEKVYHPCVLLAKKRYVGFKYESPTQSVPEFDAKGIETVRRDGTPAEQKIEENALKILFRTADLSQVKSYFQRQCTKIMMGRISMQDFLFAREVKLGTYAERGPPPPGALIATKRMLADPRTEPQYGERVPYVVVTGAPGARLIDRTVSPETLLRDEHLEIDAEYYINKNLIPPLERIFNLVGANVRQWYDEMLKVQRIRHIAAWPGRPQAPTRAAAPPTVNLKKTLESYMSSSSCIVCRAKLAPPTASDLSAPPPLPLCARCLMKPARALLELRTRLKTAEEKAQNVDRVCRSCSGLAFGEEVRCDSRDCPVFYTRTRVRTHLRSLENGIGGVIGELEARAEDLDW